MKKLLLLFVGFNLMFGIVPASSLAIKLGSYIFYDGETVGPTIRLEEGGVGYYGQEGRGYNFTWEEDEESANLVVTPEHDSEPMFFRIMEYDTLGFGSWEFIHEDVLAEGGDEIIPDDGTAPIPDSVIIQDAYYEWEFTTYEVPNDYPKIGVSITAHGGDVVITNIIFGNPHARVDPNSFPVRIKEGQRAIIKTNSTEHSINKYGLEVLKSIRIESNFGSVVKFF